MATITKAMLENENAALRRRVANLEKQLARHQTTHRALHDSESQFNSIFQHNPLGIVITRLSDNRLLQVNDAWLNLLEYDRAQVLGRTALELSVWVKPHDREKMIADLRGRHRLDYFETTLRKSTGDTIDVLISAKAVTINAEPCMITQFVDITARKQMEQALAQSEQEYRTLLNTLDVSLCRWLPDTTLLFANEKYCHIFGIHGRAAGRKWLDFLPAKTRQTTAAFYQELAQHPHIVTYEHPVTVEDGSVRQYQWIDTPIFDDAGQLVEFQSVGVDISERKQAEEALRDSEELHRLTLSNISDAVFITDMAGTFTFICPNVSTLFGYTASEIAQMGNIRELLGKDIFDPANLDQLGEIPNVECCATDKFGRAHDLLVNIKRIAIKNGTVLYVCHDITDRKHAEKALENKHQELQNLVVQLEQSRNMLQSVIESVPIRVFWKDRDLRYLGCNTLFAHDAGLSHPQQLIGKDDFAMGWHDQAELYRADDNAVIASRQPKMNIIEPQTTPAGTTIWLETSKVPLFNAGGEVYGILGVYEDITERKQAEQALRESEARLKLAQSVAHSGVWDYDIVNDKLFWTDEYYQLYNIPKEIPPSREIWLRLVHPKDRELAVKSQNQAIARKEYAAFDFRIIRPDGQVRWMNAQGAVILNPDNEPIRLIGTTVDITERKQAEEIVQAQRDLARISGTAITPQEAWASCLAVALRVSGMDSGGIYLSNDQLQRLELVYHQGLGAEFIQAVSVFPSNLPSAQMVLAGKTIYFSPANLARQKYHHDEGLISGAMIPVQSQGRVVGCLNLASHTLTEVPTHSRQALDAIVVEIGNAIMHTLTQTALRESEEKYRSLIDSQDAAISMLDGQGIFHYINDIGAAPFGTPANVVGKSVHDLFPPHIADWQSNQIRAVIQAGSGNVIEYENRIAGKPSWRRVSIQPIRNAEGNVTLAMVNSLDITERKLAEMALRESQARVELALKGANMAMWDWYVQTGKTIFNERWAEMFGYTLAELEPTTIETWLNVCHPDDLQKSNVALERHFAGKADYYECEARIKHKNGHWVWIIDRGKVVEWDTQGKPIRMSGTHMDITSRKQAEMALRDSEERYRLLFETMVQGVVFQAADGHIIHANPAAERILGLTLDQMQGRTSIDPRWKAIHEDGTDFPGETHPAMVALQTAQPVRNQIMGVYNPALDAYTWINVNAVPRFNPGEAKPYQVYTTFEDITARKLAEQTRERQTARLEILHDLDSAIIAGQSLVQIANRALELVAQVIPCDLGAIVLFDRDTSEAWLVGLHGEAVLPYALGTRGKMDPQFLGIMEQTGSWVTSEATHQPNLDPLTRRILADGAYTSLAHTAMLMDGPIFGGIRLFAHAANAFTAEHAEILAEVANQLAIAIAQMRLREQIEKHSAELEARVRERTAQVQDLYDNAPAGYHSLDANGNNVMINQTELNWLGYTREELIGHHITELLTPAGAQDFGARFPVLLRQGFIKDVEFEFVRKDGSIMPVLLTAIAIYDDQGNIANGRATITDNTERKKNEHALRESRDALNRANRELARASKLKDEFLANMSHELRTPLNAILGLSESMLEQLIGPLNERQLKSMQTVESSGQHLLALINDILDLSKIEAGSETLQIAPVAVKPICDASLMFIKQTAHKKQIQVSATIDLNVQWVAADDRRLKQMLVNLLSNAVKFTPGEGRIELHVTGDTEASTVSFSVRDTGIGIAPADIPHLFKPFVQLDGGLSRVHEGTGLGLALVARMAEMHGGSVTVESAVGTGSCFTIVLPWSEALQTFSGTHPIARDTWEEEGESRPVQVDAHAPLILIAEDNEANVLTLSTYLQAKGYRTAVARHGGEALDLARAEQPALILMDLQMPVLDGLEAMRRLRREKHPHLARLPIIALTALAMPGDRERSLAAGANDYLSKPVNMKNLLASIRYLLKDK